MNQYNIIIILREAFEIMIIFYALFVSFSIQQKAKGFKWNKESFSEIFITGSLLGVIMVAKISNIVV